MRIVGGDLVGRVADGIAGIFDGVGGFFLRLLFAASGEEGASEEQAGENEF